MNTGSMLAEFLEYRVGLLYGWTVCVCKYMCGCMRMPEYMCNTAIVVVEHKSHQTTAPWEKGQRQRWEWVQFEAKEVGGWIVEGEGASLPDFTEKKRERENEADDATICRIKKT